MGQTGHPGHRAWSEETWVQEKSPHQHQHQCWLLLLTYFELSSAHKPDPEPSQVSLLAVAAVRGWAGLRWLLHLTPPAASPSLTRPQWVHRTEVRCSSVQVLARCGGDPGYGTGGHFTGLLVVVALLTDVATAGLSAVCWR